MLRVSRIASPLAAPRLRRLAQALAAACVLVGLVGAVSAAGRDADGSRMQARALAIGQAATDSLAPPDDRIDWKYFQVAKRRGVRISVRSLDEGRSVSVSLYSAAGDEIARTSAGPSGASLSRDLAPGVYYLGLQASAGVRYRVQVD